VVNNLSSLQSLILTKRYKPDTKEQLQTFACKNPTSTNRKSPPISEP
jgi:hypothetical protein